MSLESKSKMFSSVVFACDSIGGPVIRWPSMGRNKKTVTLDFHYEEGKKLFLDLVTKSDVVIENFKTGTLDKWGIGVEEMRKVNPNIIVTHVTGYGQTGPNAKLAGLGTPLQAFSGMTYMQGYKDRPPVSPPSLWPTISQA